MDIKDVVVRFSGDSGDGIQLLGSQIVETSVHEGLNVHTFPDYPAEIRAPVGSIYGVSAFQIHISQDAVHTAGDQVDILVVFNPAALKKDYSCLKKGGILLVDSDLFQKRQLEKVHYGINPLEDKEFLKTYCVLSYPVSTFVMKVAETFDISRKLVLKSRNFWFLGLIYWILGEDKTGTECWLQQKFQQKEDVLLLNLATLRAGYFFGETVEMDHFPYCFKKSQGDPGLSKVMTGNEALALGIAGAGILANIPVFLGSYPITPASPVLHRLVQMHDVGVISFQAEDEISAICAAIGASYGGSLGVALSSGPGISLKAEALGFAVMTELPLLVFDIQRGGPSTGLPTKVEQSDLNLALYGRHGDCPLVVMACSSPKDVFSLVIAAARIAISYRTPVIFLSDVLIANSSVICSLPQLENYESIDVQFSQKKEDIFGRKPEGMRGWVKAGTSGLAHVLGGLEQDSVSGGLSYESDNHETMTKLREKKIQSVGVPDQLFEIEALHAKALIIAWGSTYGSIFEAVTALNQRNFSVSYIHLRYLHPLPKNLTDLVKGFQKIIVIEMNTGQMLQYLQSYLKRFLEGIHQIQGRPFQLKDLYRRIEEKLQ